jgi:hypothetical protein
MACAVLASLAALGPPVSAAAGPAKPVIANARVDLVANTITIEGTDLGSDTPIVRLNLIELTVQAATPTLIVADLYPNISSGSYLLSVLPGPNYNVEVKFEVTIGAQGPPGPEGPAGPQLPAGSQRSQGPIGLPAPHEPSAKEDSQGLLELADLPTAFVSGQGKNPTSSLSFLSPIVQMRVASGERVFITATKTLGSTAQGGGKNLDLYICYRRTFIGSPMNTIGIGLPNLRVPQNTKLPFTLSADFAPGVGTFNFGLCGATSDPGGWNSNDNGYVTAILHQ